MTITVAAVYEGGGVLKLERPVDLKENAKGNVIIETEPAALAAFAGGANSTPPAIRTGFQVASVHSMVECSLMPVPS